MAGENVGVARLDIIVSTETMQAEIEKAKRTVGAFGGVAQDSFNKSTNASNRALDALTRFVLMQGKSAEEQRLLRAQLQGVPTDKIEMLAAEMRSAAAAARDVQDSVNFERQRVESQKLFQAAEYVKFWNQQLDAMEVQQAQTNSQNVFLSQLNQQAAAIGKTRVDLLEMRAAELGVADAARPMITALRAQENALYGTSTQLNKYGLSAKQVQFALRGVPAQITDIFVSLQGGQNPLTVLLQQGGQLKDMFGGIAPAASALGGAFMKLINPITLLVAGSAALFAAWYQGDKESRNLETSLVKVSARVGATVDDLAMMSIALDENTNATRRASAAAVSAVTSTGAFTADQIGLVSRAAIQMQTITGQAIDDTIKEFQKLAEDPVKAIEDLNKSQGFLTYEIYNTITALKDQGDELGAQQLAIETYANAVEERTGKIEENLGYLERAWRAVSSTAKEAWDSMLDAGRERTGAEKMQGLFSQLQAAQANLDKLKAQQAEGGNINAYTRNLRAAAERQYRAQIDTLRESIAKQSQANTDALRETQQAAENARAEEYAIDVAKTARQFADKETKKTAEIATLTTKFESARRLLVLQGRTEEVEKLEAQFADAKEGIEKKYEERSRKKRERRQAESPAVGIMERLNDQIRLNEEAAKSEDKLTASERLAVRVQNDLLESGKKLTDQERAAIELKLAELKVTGDRAKAWAEEVKLKDELLRLTTELDAAESVARQRANDEIAGMELGDRAREQMAARLKIEREFVEAVSKLRDKGYVEESEGWKRQVELLRAHRDEMLGIEENYQERRSELEGKWETGFRRALERNREEAANTAAVSESLFSHTFDALGEKAVEFSRTGKIAFDDLAQHISEVAIKLLTQRAIIALLDYFFPQYGGGNAAMQQGVKTGGNVKGFAKGDSFSGSPSLSAYSNQVVNKPTPFFFAKGAALGVMGEAGDEAIMPLTRTSDGKLGVNATGGAGGNVVVNVFGAPSEPEVQTKKDDQGNMQIDVMFKQIEASIAQGVAEGRSPVGTAMKRRYGLQEKA
jgi:lambda family phage tail tape measure protein